MLNCWWTPRPIRKRINRLHSTGTSPNAPHLHAGHGPDRHVLHDGRCTATAAATASTSPIPARPIGPRSSPRSGAIPKHTTDLEAAIGDPDSDMVIVALPNHLHEEAVIAAAEAGKAVLCTKPLGRNAAEARRMLEAVERAGVFHGYLEDLCYTPKTLKALESVRQGALGKVLWVRSRETHSGPHSDWFWNKELSGGGAIVDLGCHCIEIARNFIGKDIRPVEVVCWGDTQVHPIEAEDHAVGLVRYENGAVGQFEVSWTFRGGMDLRDEVAGTDGTIWLNHWLRTGMEMYTAVGQAGYVAEKAEGTTGWLFPVGDETARSATSTCSPTCSTRSMSARRRARRSTTATSSTRSSTRPTRRSPTERGSQSSSPSGEARRVSPMWPPSAITTPSTC